ncbi:uncharacterized protein LOC126907874 isoform X2 [Daktulosphaira vitifoliae]|uniref:uncharacterized protein LOC126907874 isoform X2 n=1 Tax=Daktulosphaira vitifoliae TaxID=58002 RepID=UPI0021A9A101|nr:uncharacterized protein LOC126907874 isoform X2 [Daktulosphaira vitifoliae]
MVKKTSKDSDPIMITAKLSPPNKMTDHVARLRVVQEVSSRNSSVSWTSSCTISTEKSWTDQPRPPVYNPEDYAASLRKFGKRSSTPDSKNEDSLKSKEMTLKEFSSATELLDKLKTDLKLAYFSFVQEFVGDPIDGITLLLELLKTIQQSGSQTKSTPANQRRITLDENACLQCLKYCLRCQDAARKLAISSAGLYTLAACIMSTINQSRLITLELLTTACCDSGTVDGHITVSDAMSTMRLRFAEPVRFRFLVGMMSGNGNSGMELLLAGLKFINAFTETCPDLQTRFYIQAELKQAGFKPAGILKNISNKSPLLSLVSEEIYKWQKNFINVESLKRQHDEVVREAKTLRERVSILEKKLHLLQDEKRVVSSRKEITDKTHKNKIEGCGNSAEDEGISSSEQDDCEEEVTSKKLKMPYKMYDISQDDPTIEEVLETFDKVINDASTDSNERQNSSISSDSKQSYDYSPLYTEDAVIIPAKIIPEPPRRSRSLFINKNFEVNPFFEDDEESMDSVCLYNENEIDIEKSKVKRSETFHSVQKHIKRFSDIALQKKQEENEKKEENHRKSIYDIFSTIEQKKIQLNRQVMRSASTKNINESRLPMLKFDQSKPERAVYFPSGCKNTRDQHRTLMARGHNNAGLYSGYRDVKGINPKHQSGSNSSLNSLNELRHVNMSLSTGKLTDFPSGLY